MLPDPSFSKAENVASFQSADDIFGALGKSMAIKGFGYNFSLMI